MEELNSKDFISRNEKGMKYEVEEMDNLQKKISPNHIDLPIPEQEKNIKNVGILLNMPILNVELNSKRIEEIKATYYYNPNSEGKILVGDDGSYLLTISSAIDFNTLLDEFKKGRRNGNFNTISMNDKELRKIVEETVGSNDPFWNEPVYNIVKKILDLPEGAETTITSLLGNSNYTSKQLSDIHSCVNRVCEKLSIKLDFGSNNKLEELPYNLPFKKANYK